MSEARLYLADASALSDEALFAVLYAKMPAERRAKIDGYVFPKDRRLCLAAGLLLERCLREAGLERWELEYGRWGKPRVRGGEGPCFNLSHSGERVLCALSGSEVGCDIEQLADFEQELARRFFTAGEYAYIAARQTEAERSRAFYRLWTLKESFMKATGLGMRLALDSFELDLGAAAPALRRSPSAEAWRFREFDFGGGYLGAVCSLEPAAENAVFVDITDEEA